MNTPPTTPTGIATAVIAGQMAGQHHRQPNGAGGNLPSQSAAAGPPSSHSTRSKARPHSQNGQVSLPEVSEHSLTPKEALSAFLRALEGRNRSPLTIRAYKTDVGQFVAWLGQNTWAPTVDQVERADITEYLSFLGARQVSGVSRARKLAAIREFFRYLEGHGHINRSPAAAVETPKKERNVRSYLRPDEYTRMLSEAGANPRDYAILQVFLQTGIRVSELCDLRIGDVELTNRMITVTGKGQVERSIELEKKGLAAIRTWLAVRPKVLDDHLFLNYQGEPLGERGVRKLVVRYKSRAGITKKIGPHSFRHTFGTLKAEQGVSPFQLKEWLGHAKLDTTQIYVHMGRSNAKKVMEATSL